MGIQKKQLETPERPIGKTDEGIGVFFMIDRNPGLAIDFRPRKARNYEGNRKGKTERGKSRSYERFSSRSLSSFCFSQLVLSSKT